MSGPFFMPKYYGGVAPPPPPGARRRRQSPSPTRGGGGRRSTSRVAAAGQLPTSHSHNTLRHTSRRNSRNFGSHDDMRRVSNNQEPYGILRGPNSRSRSRSTSGRRVSFSREDQRHSSSRRMSAPPSKSSDFQVFDDRRAHDNLNLRKPGHVRNSSGGAFPSQPFFVTNAIRNQLGHTRKNSTSASRSTSKKRLASGTQRHHDTNAYEPFVFDDRRENRNEFRSSSRRRSSNHRTH